MRLRLDRKGPIAVTAGIVALLSLVIAFVLPGLLFPAQPRLSEEAYAELFPYESRYLDLESGARVHYVDEGQGPPLLLMHGNPASAFLYRHLIGDLMSDFRVIAFDYPGFGKSLAHDRYGYSAMEQAETALEFFDSLDLQNAVIMMQDWGGPIGFHIVQQRSNRVRGLIIGNTWAWPLAGNLRYEIFSWIMGGPIGRGINRSRIGVVHTFLRRGVVTPLPRDAYAAYFQRFLDGDRTPVTTFPRELVQAEPFLTAIESRLHRIGDIEALIVWGEQDFAFGADFRQRFETYFPNHRTLLLPDAGHFIQEDAPREIALAVRESFGSR